MITNVWVIGALVGVIAMSCVAAAHWFDRYMHEKSKLDLCISIVFVLLALRALLVI